MAEQLQQVLSNFLQASVPISPASNSSNVLASNTTQNSTQTSPIPGSLLAMIPILFSFSGLHDWVKIVLLGGFFETCRRTFSMLYQKVIESFYMVATFDEEDASYQWMMVWLSKQPAWSSIREVEVSTETYGADSSAINIDDDEDDELDMKVNTKTLLHTFPLKDVLNVVQAALLDRYAYAGAITMGKDQYIDVEEARRAYLDAQEHKMCIWSADSTNNWRQVARREKRSLKSIVLDPGVKDLIISDARDFLSSRKWYTERGIPFRRGYLLYGAPGSGKTSLIHSMAGELELDVYIISLSRIGLDDAGLDQLINDLPERCVALMEDIDAAFTHGLTREPEDDKGEDSGDEKKSGPKSGPGSGTGASGLLNALDGIGAQEGRILFATTNKYTSLDPALCRPGRMDIHIEFKLASKYQARELFKRFYNPSDSLEEVAEAVGIYSKDLNSTSDNDSGYTSSVDESETPGTDVDSSKPVVWGSMHHERAHKLTMSRINTLAERFAAAIPERQISMASLQGYLMNYKIRAVDAVKDVEAWIEKVLKEKQEKEQKKKGRQRRREAKEKRKAKKSDSDEEESEPKTRRQRKAGHVDEQKGPGMDTKKSAKEPSNTSTTDDTDST
ncbi:hypothetical protein VNI00_000093 [Paramarasmius palmivorus]|uniref:P-loop containing nucleoside triphosphate hydrolase protein n=1 Tax=Paramarasmius palmivorus TaxID=297713 RepID=A0AAW0EEP9_9AGAR